MLRPDSLPKITLDFETQSRANLKKVGAFVYSEDPSTRAACLAVQDHFGGMPFFFNFEDIQEKFKNLDEYFQSFWIENVRKGTIFSAHNAFFEQCIYNNVLVKRQGWPPIPLHQWRCTAAKAAIMSLPRSLAGAGEALKLSVQKDLKGHIAMMKLCKPRKKDNEFWTPETAPQDFAILYAYCKRDVEAEVALDKALPDLPPSEQELWFLDQKINQRGVCVDMPVVKKIIQIREKETAKMLKEVDSLTEGLIESTTQRQALLNYLADEGYDLPDLRSATVEEYLSEGKVNGDCKRLLEIRRALSKSSTAKYNKFLERTSHDNRVRDLYLYSGAGTRRWTGVGIQPQNFPRGNVKDIAEAIERIKSSSTLDLKLLYGDNLGPLFASCLRGMLIATPGFELFQQDFSAIETRVLWWLAGNEEGLKIFGNGEDPYIDMAAYVFNKPWHQVSDEERQLGKAIILGCGYQMGAPKFLATCETMYRIKLTEAQAKNAVNAYRTKHAAVPKFWENINNATKAAVENKDTTYRVGRIRIRSNGKWLQIRLPSGGKISYAYPKVEWQITQWGSNSRVVSYWAPNPKTKKWNKETTYGGKLVENIVQAASRDLLAEAMMRAEAKGYRVLMHSHDEIVSETKLGVGSNEEFGRIVSESPDWAVGLPIESKGWSGLRYKK